ncbi:cold-inducible protein YdjO-related protein [Paenibacillus sp. J2TS4]|uniref:cold-inducible protein YdjO-related protein n=1 Tax=Paenibacillus sp. J2TS4 TaxID=2807194 RepID=UPI001B19B402|nr:cold-inducible protein YdjO-related protein [Paenibacillus sp. J2TS4]GIP35238.1 hypothetical protein J2TS4_44480 [Paenibacillus sp. J2TS4]
MKNFPNKNKSVKEPPVVEAKVWICVNEQCSGWMRAEFAFKEEPECPLCHSAMSLGVKVVPKIS